MKINFDLERAEKYVVHYPEACLKGQNYLRYRAPHQTGRKKNCKHERKDTKHTL